MHIFDKKARKDIRPFILQSSLATLAIFFILLFLDVLSHTAIIATLGSSAFLIFSRPHTYDAKPRFLIGGYLIGIFVGVIFHYITLIPEAISLPISISTSYIIFSAMAVGVAIFLMVVTDTEHPPAAGMALGLVINPWDHKTLLFILCAVLAMAILRRVLQDYMIDLL